MISTDQAMHHARQLANWLIQEAAGPVDPGQERMSQPCMDLIEPLQRMVGRVAGELPLPRCVTCGGLVLFGVINKDNP